MNQELALTDDQLIQINHACNQFEKEWQNGRRPRTEEFLDGIADHDQAILLRELLPLEAEYRRLSNKPLTLDECHSRFPGADSDWLHRLVRLHPGSDGNDSSSKERPPPYQKSFGNYELLETIGEGGVVYRAEQHRPVRRMVAVKLMKEGVDSRSVLARFEAERQALAIMDHPGIASIYDAGTTQDGRPYFVMELVRGVPITQYCGEYKLSVIERLKLFVSVCGAVQHAHQKGVIHRDIKPNNVLVAIQDGMPVSKVIDFGVPRQSTSV